MFVVENEKGEEKNLTLQSPLKKGAPVATIKCKFYSHKAERARKVITLFRRGEHRVFEKHFSMLSLGYKYQKEKKLSY